MPDSDISTDSDDDFSYTNTASMLKALKKDISISEQNLPMEKSIEENSIDVILSDDAQTDLDTPSTANSVSKNNESLVIVSDDELLNSPINLISTIDSVLVKAKTKCKTSNKKRKCKTVKLDEDILNSSVNLVSKIDGVLTKKNANTRRGRGRKGISNPRRSTRQKQKPSNLEATVLLHKVNSITDTCTIDDNNDLQESNYEIDIKVIWMSQYLKKFSIRRFDKMQAIFKFFSERENIPENKLIFTIEKDSVILSKNDTPDSLNINAATIIEGGIKCIEKAQPIIKSKPDKNCIEIKVQLKDRKRPLTISIKSVDQMEVLMHKTATELEVNVKNLKFYFDGDLIKPNDTVQNLELQNGECIDCIKTI